MTPIERARLRCGCGQCKPWEINPDAPKVVREHCRAVDLYDVQLEAMAEEREACARLAEAYHDDGDNIATDIRARGQVA